MNEQQFETNLRAAFLAPEMPSHLDQKIDAAVEKFKNRKQIRRRITLSLCATAAITAGIFIFPAVDAQAKMSGMMNALDKETSAKLIKYSVDEQGRRFLADTTVIANGNVETFNSKQVIEQIDFDDKTYVYDATSNSYIQSPRRQHGIRLSQLLGPTGGFSLHKRVELERAVKDGKKILRATITDNNLPERTIIEADAETELPISFRSDSLEMGKWRTRQIGEFICDPNLRVTKPDFSKTPLLTREESDSRIYRFWESKTVARLDAKKESLIIRAVDMSDDGSVFVLFQRGEKVSNRWSGDTIALKDDVGTKYLPALDEHLVRPDNAKVPKDGWFESEIFIPEQPIKLGVKRTLKVTAMPMDGTFDRSNNWIQIQPDGTKLYKVSNQSGKETPAVKILDMAVSESTCAIFPEWCTRLRFEGFFRSADAEIMKANWRSIHAIQSKNWEAAEKWLNEELRIKREAESQGLGPWEMGSNLRDLEMVRKKLRA